MFQQQPKSTEHMETSSELLNDLPDLGSLGSRQTADYYHRSQEAKWSSAATTWHLAAPPATPSQEDLRHFQSALREPYDGQDVLILGSTPLLRQLFGGLGCRVVVADFNESIYSSTTAYLDPGWHEEFWNVDWLQIDTGTHSNRFDLIVGDKVLDNLHPTVWTTVFQLWSELLRRDGRLVQHIGTQDESIAHFGPAELLHQWAAKLARGTIDEDAAVSGYWEDLLATSGRLNNEHLLSIAYWKEQLIDLDASRLVAGERELFEKLIHTFGTTFGGMWTDCSIDLVKEHSHEWFVVEKVLYSTDYDTAKNHPLLVMSALQST